MVSRFVGATPCPTAYVTLPSS
ncbi:hypothetical protein CGRA01v4_13718 [Colletotrichum graminicola]|nr:hypothetical protein CGRA01v4_13718 [Colletotrichum graminicola]